ncbi:MAG: hypothetical protein AAF533_27430 [Acidobacteriota bacterium]
MSRRLAAWLLGVAVLPIVIGTVAGLLREPAQVETPKPVPPRQPGLWRPEASAEEKTAALTELIDGQVGKPFPDVQLRRPGLLTDDHLSLHDVTEGSLVVLNYGPGCPYSEADVEYFESVGWKPLGHDALVIMIPEAMEPSLPSMRLQWGLDAPIYFTSGRLPGWLDRLRVSPQTYIVSADGLLVDWAIHLEEAKEHVARTNARLKQP